MCGKGSVHGNDRLCVHQLHLNVTYLTDQKLPLLFVQGRINQHKYNQWHQDMVVPWVRDT